MRGKGLKLHRGRVRLDVSKQFCSERVGMYWNGLRREVVETLSPEVLKERADVAFRDVVSRHCGNGSLVEPDLRGLSRP